MLLQVIFERSEAHGQRAAVAERAEPRIDAEHEAILRPRIEQTDELAAQTIEVLLELSMGRAPSVSPASA